MNLPTHLILLLLLIGSAHSLNCWLCADWTEADGKEVDVPWGADNPPCNEPGGTTCEADQDVCALHTATFMVTKKDGSSTNVVLEAGRCAKSTVLYKDPEDPGCQEIESLVGQGW